MWPNLKYKACALKNCIISTFLIVYKSGGTLECFNGLQISELGQSIFTAALPSFGLISGTLQPLRLMVS